MNLRDSVIFIWLTGLCRELYQLIPSTDVSLLPSTYPPNGLRLLQGLCFLLFAGRAWQFFRWPSPIHSVWDWPLPTAFGMGVVLALLAGLCLVLFRVPVRPWTRPLLPLGSLLLLLLTLASWQAKSFQLAQLIEHSIQWTLPLLLWWAWMQAAPRLAYQAVVKLTISLTFVGHGLYALGMHGGVPANFLAMTHNILGLPEAGARQFLFVIGLLDLVVALGLWARGKEAPFLWYAIIWGTLTALARVVAYVELPTLASGLDRWVFETLVRLGHGGVPLFLLWLLQGQRQRHLQPEGVVADTQRPKA